MNYSTIRQYIKLAQKAKEKRAAKEASQEVEQSLTVALTEAIIHDIDDELTKPDDSFARAHAEPVEDEVAPAPPVEPEEGLVVDPSATDLASLKKHELWALIKERGLQGELVYASVTAEQLLEILSA
jgi:hypothetical protein